MPLHPPAGAHGAGIGPVRSIVVVGAGIAGLACALACARSGAKVQLLDAGDALAGVPAHLEVVPNLLRDLAGLGVAQDCLRLGFAYNGIAIVDESGRTAFSAETPRLAGDRLPAALGIAYDDAMRVLTRHARESGAAISHGTPVTALDARHGEVLTASGQRLRADLVVLATGAASALADEVLGRATPGVSQCWWHALLPRPAGLDRATWMAGLPGRRLLLVPVGMSRAGLAVVRTAAVPERSDGRALRETLVGWGEMPRRLASLIDDATPTCMRTTGGRLREGPWHRGRVLCIGASAHEVAPAFGQAAAQGVEDAIVLGELLGAGLDAPTLLDRYMQRREARARRVHALIERGARWVTQPEPATDLMALGAELGAMVSSPP